MPRPLPSALAGKQFTNRQDAQRYRQDRLTEIDEAIRQYQTGPQIAGVAGARCANSRTRRRAGAGLHAQRGNSMTVANSVPAFVYARRSAAPTSVPSSGADAEREYKAAIAADPKSGEAFNNLAVVYLQTQRYKEAEDAVKAAEKAGYKVHPQLKEDIKAKLKT